MATYPTTSTWADDPSDDEGSRLIDNDVNGYQSIQQTLQDHQEGLNRLGDAIRRQRNVADDLANEVELHNEILENIDTGLTRTDVNLQKNTRNIRLVLKKSSTCSLWVLIFILAAIIIALTII